MKGLQCVWYTVFPYLIHRCYVHENYSLLQLLLETTIKNNENIIGYVLLGGVGLTVISCLERCDFNLFLFIFVFYTIYSSGHQAKVIPQIEHTELMLTSVMFVFSIVIDLLWVCFYRNTVTGVVCVVNYIEIVLKVVIGNLLQV